MSGCGLATLLVSVLTLTISQCTRRGLTSFDRNLVLESCLSYTCSNVYVAWVKGWSTFFCGCDFSLVISPIAHLAVGLVGTLTCENISAGHKSNSTVGLAFCISTT